MSWQWIRQAIDMTTITKLRPALLASTVILMISVITRKVARLWFSGMKNKAKYIGEFDRKGRRCCHGKLVLPNGDFYEGDFSNNLYNGTGMYVFKDGKSYYQGQFKDSMYHGKGEEVYGQSGTRYYGQFKESRRNGYGTMDYESGASYTGRWKNGLKHGLGAFRYANGDTFSGKFVNGVKSGPGEYTASTFKIVGNWDDNKPCSNATVYCSEGFSEDMLDAFRVEGEHPLKIQNENDL